MVDCFEDIANSYPIIASDFDSKVLQDIREGARVGCKVCTALTVGTRDSEGSWSTFKRSRIKGAGQNLELGNVGGKLKSPIFLVVATRLLWIEFQKTVNIKHVMEPLSEMTQFSPYISFPTLSPGRFSPNISRKNG